jgi:hypothetical protein
MRSISIEFRTRAPGQYEATVTDATTHKTFDSPFDLSLGDSVMTHDGVPITIATLYSALDGLSVPLQQQFGQALFDRMFRGHARETLVSGFEAARDRDEEFHLDVCLPADDDVLLGSLPLELLTDDAALGFWFRCPQASLVRRCRALVSAPPC